MTDDDTARIDQFMSGNGQFCKTNELMKKCFQLDLVYLEMLTGDFLRRLIMQRIGCARRGWDPRHVRKTSAFRRNKINHDHGKQNGRAFGLQPVRFYALNGSGAVRCEQPTPPAGFSHRRSGGSAPPWPCSNPFCQLTGIAHFFVFVAALYRESALVFHIARCCLLVL